jgi:purine-cytosine permease-like protein
VLPGTITGPLAAALGEVDVAWIVGLAVTAGAYLLFSRSLDRSAEHAAEESSEARLGHVAS